MRHFVLIAIMKFISGVFIMSTFILTLDQWSNHNAFLPYMTNHVGMTYVEAAYFIIVSFSTIGYGDIVPSLWV